MQGEERQGEGAWARGKIKNKEGRRGDEMRHAGQPGEKGKEGGVVGGRRVRGGGEGRGEGEGVRGSGHPGKS